MTIRNLCLVLGDQCDLSSQLFEHFDPAVDKIVMLEVAEECEHVWTHKLRIAAFFSVMRHFRDAILHKYPDKLANSVVIYHELTADPAADLGRTHAEVLKHVLQESPAQNLVVVKPGDWRIEKQLREFCQQYHVTLQILPDHHFYCTEEEFHEYARDKKTLVMEFFYRLMRKQHNILVDAAGKPEGGSWNYDHENRESFTKAGPPDITPPPSFKPDKITKGVLKLVNTRFASHPGNLDHFNLPVTTHQARQQLDWFITHALEQFGPYEDAMWLDHAFLFHSRLSFPLNLKLLNPRECVQAALNAYEHQQISLPSCEGFVRQILGWREFIRGIYWWTMPGYQEKNALHAERELPQFFWDGQTDMACVKNSMQHVLNHGYTHHIQRLMVLGNLAQLIGVHPYKFHEWHMAMYLDAVDWVSLPNALGMSQYGDGGIVGTKPYCSTGNYISKMSNFCKHCPYDFKKRHGKDACPYTTLYWDFLDRNQDLLQYNQRMSFAYKNLERIQADPVEYKLIKQQAQQLMATWYQSTTPEDAPA